MKAPIHRGDAETRRNARRKTFERILVSHSPRFSPRLRVSAVNGYPLLWISILAVSVATAQVSKETPSPKDLKYTPLRAIQIPDVTYAVLPNGMKLYLLEDHELPVIGGVVGLIILVIYKRGYAEGRKRVEGSPEPDRPEPPRPD